MAIIGIATVSVLALAYANSYASIRKVRASLNTLNLFSQIQLNLRNTIDDHDAWQATIADPANASMSCILSRSCTSDVPPTAFTLWAPGVTNYSDRAKAVYDGQNASAGFALDGNRCFTFSASGTSACPVHVELTWQAQACSPAPCDAKISIQSKILYRPDPTTSSVLKVNESKLAILYDRKEAGSSTNCLNPASPNEALICASPPYPDDQLVCTSSGLKCGRVYY